ncbi:MAG: hypothetical protein H6940_12500 [Burkholderiales bacterium]|nr:hypothetical protein [Burkholderiales bacterium]
MTDTDSESQSMLGKAFIGVAVVMAIILLFYFLPYRSTESSMHSIGSTYGRILVDSPEVYTRERMVNDRFRQEAWLVEHLNKQEEAGVQGAVAGRKTSGRSADVSFVQNSEITNGNDQKPNESNLPADTEQDKADIAAAGQPKLTRIEAFRDEQSFREEVRSAIIENQLDDRHDLGGNTLYRLKFDASIIPGSDTSAWARINVRFGRIKIKGEEVEIREVYDRWVSDLQELTRLRIKEATDAMDEKEIYENGWRQLGLEVGEETKKLGSLSDFFATESSCKIMAISEQPIKQSSKEDMAKYQISEYSDESYECLISAYSKIDGCSKNCKDLIIGRTVSRRVGSEFGITLGEKQEGDMDGTQRHKDSKDVFYDLHTRSGRVQEQPFVNFSPNDDRTSIIVDERKVKFDAFPYSISEKELLRFKDYLNGQDYESGVEKRDPIALIEFLRKLVLNCDENEAKLITIAKGRFYLCEEGSKQLDLLNRKYGHLTEIDWTFDNRGFFIEGMVGFYDFWEKLLKSDDQKFLFSYAVTPRESSQQMASSSRLAVAEQLRVNASAGAGVDAGAGLSSSISEYARIMDRRPIIVGIASHGSRDEMSAKFGGQSAEFGWLIGPKLVIGKNGLPNYRHLPSQNSLAALVSAPSWWRRANIKIETTWLNEDGEPVGPSAKIDYSIALPGDQEEISSALLLGGKRPAPIVDSFEPKSLDKGKEAKILIEGQNLWRSTVVTIGAQRSKRIFVLPNMKGIIAEFDKIEAQATELSTTEPEGVTLRVWTSEGMAKFDKNIMIQQKGVQSSLSPSAAPQASTPPVASTD